jgi:hypothetical protein
MTLDPETQQRIHFELLLDGLVEPVNLAAIESRVNQHYPAASDPQLIDETVRTIRSLINDGLMEPGYLGDKSQFIRERLDQWMGALTDTYVTKHEEPAEWVFSYWLNLTDKGRRIALSTEEGKAVDRHERERIAGLRAAGYIPPPE